MNHYLRMFNYPYENIDKCDTQREFGADGGELMFFSIFNKRYFLTINDYLADILLDSNNWNLTKEELNDKINTLPSKVNCVIKTMNINKKDSDHSWYCISSAERAESQLPKVEK